MARPKGAKNRTKHVFKDPSIEEVVEEYIEFTCPIRGKIRQKVKVKRLKKVVHEQKVFVGAQSIIDDLEKKQDEEELLGTEPDSED